MLRKKTIIILSFTLCLLLLAGCGKTGEKTGAEPAPATSAPWEPETLPEIAGEERQPPEEPDGPTDGLEGSYYNDYLRETLILDGRGGCSVTWPGGAMGGFYSRSDNGDLAVSLAEIRLTVRFDDGGDLSIDGKQGRYLHDWDFWGITPAEAGIHPVNTLPDTEEVALGGGAYRYRDFPSGLALTYKEPLQILQGRIPGALCVADGAGGYVVGRNVTQRYSAGSAEDFLDAYIRDDVTADAEALYGAVSEQGEARLVSGETGGRLAAGEITLKCGGKQITARVILYISAFDDGTVHRICKCILVPAGQTAQFEALAAGVYDMGAARIVQLS